jgi:hypothetical protein
MELEQIPAHAPLRRPRHDAAGPVPRERPEPAGGAGSLCIYEASEANLLTPVVADVNFGGNASSPFGASVLAESSAGVSGTSNSRAATAP